MFVPTKAILKLANRDTEHSQGIGIILCNFPNCFIIYSVRPVYYFPGHPSNTTSSGALKYYFDFQNVTPENHEYCDFVDPQGCSWIPPYQAQKNVDFLQIEFFKVNPQRSRNIVVSTVYDLLKQNLS